MDTQPPKPRRGQYQDVIRRSSHLNGYETRDRPKNGRSISTPAPTKPPESSSKPKYWHVAPNIKLPKMSYEMIAVAATAILLVLALSYGVFVLLMPKPPIPAQIHKKLSFAVYYPSDKQLLSVDKSTFEYNADTEVVTFTGKKPDGTKVSFSEQATPSNFVDIPQVYDKLVTSLSPYLSFDSVNGKVNLTHPKELKGGQTAVLNNEGTLVFVRPDKALSDNQWRQVFTNLSLIK